MKNMQKGIISIISIMVLLLTFCSAITAHPGHGEHYPEEITNTTPSTPTPAQTTTSTSTSSSTSKSSAKKSTTTKESEQTENTGNQNTDNQAENQPVKEISNTSEVNVSSSGDSDSYSSPWNPFILVGGFIAGFAAVGLLIKRGIL